MKYNSSLTQHRILNHLKDSHSIRRAAVRFKIPYFTTISAAKLAITGIGVIKGKKTAVKSLQEYYKD